MMVNECVLWQYLEDLPGQAAPPWSSGINILTGGRDFRIFKAAISS